VDIAFSGFYKKDIYFRTIWWIYKPSTSALIIRIAAFLLFGALYTATIINSFKADGASSFEVARMVRHLITFLILGYILFQPYINSYRKSSELWNDPVIRRNITGRVSTTGIIIDPMKEWLTWDKFVKVNHQLDSIALLTASRMFVLLQRDFFQDEQDWKMFQNMVAAKVQEVIE